MAAAAASRPSTTRRRAASYAAWERDAEGALALLILLDQIPRNIFRKSPHAFATDGLAQAIAARALDRGFDAATDSTLRFFFYMPFEHAEDLAMQERCVTLFTDLGDANYLKFAILHRDIIARFGRFPHRNAHPRPQEHAGGIAVFGRGRLRRIARLARRRRNANCLRSRASTPRCNGRRTRAVGRDVRWIVPHVQPMSPRAETRPVCGARSSRATRLASFGNAQRCRRGR